MLDVNYWSVLFIIANLSGVIFFLLFLLSAYQNVLKTHSLSSLGLVIVNATFLTLYLFRREAKTTIEYHFAWLMSFTGTVLPVFLRPTDNQLFPEIVRLGDITQIFGLSMIFIALLSLQRSFGVVPANRGIRQGGLYRLVRHPLYAAELAFLCGYVIANQSPLNLFILLLDFVTQYSRARIEEGFLINDPAYKLYMARIRYRFIPGLL